MLLKEIVLEKTIEFFRSKRWNDLQNLLNQGKVVRHIHFFVDSSLHPNVIKQIVEKYYDAKGHPLKRKVILLPQPGKVINIYNIHPEINMAHFEIFVRYNSNIVITPSPENMTRDYNNLVYWDDDFMRRFYSNFNFSASKEDINEAIEFFKSDEWKLSCFFMTGGKSLHSHCFVETRIDPELLLKIGEDSIKSKGWDVVKAVSIVFGLKGYDQGKITYLLKKPEIVLELEWEFNQEVSIKPGVNFLCRTITEDEIAPILSSFKYITLSEQEVDHVVNRIIR